MESMPTARSYHAGATVRDRWYVAGGTARSGTTVDGGGERFPSEVDVYDPTSGHWTVLGQLAEGREYILAIADRPGSRVLFPGGFLPAAPSGYLALATCDVASLDGVASAPTLLGARHLHAVALAAGKFVVSGGWGMDQSASKLLDDAEMWDGTSAGWTAAGRMPSGTRASHTMTTLQNGREVLVVGGGRPDRALSLVDVFDASCGTWSRAAPLKVARAGHRAVLLNDGRVLVVGGFTYPPTSNNVQSTTELFDPATRSWTLAASMTDSRFDFDTVLLPDGRVLVAGGSNNATDGEYGALSSAEVYDPIANTWTALPLMHDRRRRPTVAMLSDGVYVAGGSNSQSTVPGSAIVLASVERLAWSDLGITGPIELDAGAREAISPDASASCGSNDAGVELDAATDAGDPADAASDATQPADAAVLDGAAPDREPRGGKSGCSCGFGDTGDDWPATLALACVALGAALRRPPRPDVAPADHV